MIDLHRNMTESRLKLESSRIMFESENPALRNVFMLRPGREDAPTEDLLPRIPSGWCRKFRDLEGNGQNETSCLGRNLRAAQRNFLTSVRAKRAKFCGFPSRSAPKSGFWGYFLPEDSLRGPSAGWCRWKVDTREQIQSECALSSDENRDYIIDFMRWARLLILFKFWATHHSVNHGVMSYLCVKSTRTVCSSTFDFICVLRLVSFRMGVGTPERWNLHAPTTLELLRERNLWEGIWELDG